MFAGRSAITATAELLVVLWDMYNNYKRLTFNSEIRPSNAEE